MVDLNSKWDWVKTDSGNFKEALYQIFNTNDNLFILGPGGVGKSILLRIVYDHFPDCLVLGSTGISASNLTVDGVPASTIHSAFELPPIQLFQSITPSNDVKALITKTKLILIDEISMVPASLMDFILKTAVTSSEYVKPRIILFGDIFQLPPVKTQDETVKKYYERFYDGNYFFFNSRFYHRMNFKVVHLTGVYRQTNKEFIEILNRIRLGLASKEDLDIINTRVLKDKNKFIEENPLLLYLASTNKQVNQLNEEYSNRKEFSGFETYIAEKEGTCDMKDYPTISESIRIARGQQVMCLANNWEMGYQNGTLGIVEEVFSDRVLIVTAEGSRAVVGKHVWKKYKYLYDEKTDAVQLIIEGSVTQIGCKPAFAVTFHKSQGLTLDSILVDLSSWFIPQSGIYLALSRCKTLEGIGLTRPIRESDIKVNPEALEFLANNLLE